MLKVIISVIFILICVALTVIVLLQEGKSAGLGSVGGMADTYWGRTRDVPWKAIWRNSQPLQRLHLWYLRLY